MTTSNEKRKEFALNNLNEIKTIQIEKELTKALKKYNRETGLIPGNLKDLARYGYIKDIPTDPLGGKFIIIDNIIEVRSSRLAEHKYKYAIEMLTASSNRFKRLYGRYPHNLKELRVFFANNPFLDFPENPYGSEFQYNKDDGTVR